VIDAGLVDNYFEARQTGNVEYLHPQLESILSDTYGIIVFQEQAMKIAMQIAGFSPSESDTLRKAIGKKDMELMSSIRDDFLSGCAGNDIASETAEELWEQTSFFGGYGFNKAHAAGYANLTYQTAYLKAQYPLEYLASLLSVKINDKEDRLQCIRDARQHGIRVLPPDVNASTDRCTIVDDNAIRLPLTAVDRLAEKACVAIVGERLYG
jgi:DNA polymerase-3 subunit alpha